MDLKRLPRLAPAFVPDLMLVLNTAIWLQTQTFITRLYGLGAVFKAAGLPVLLSGSADTPAILHSPVFVN